MAPHISTAPSSSGEDISTYGSKAVQRILPRLRLIIDHRSGNLEWYEFLRLLRWYRRPAYGPPSTNPPSSHAAHRLGIHSCVLSTFDAVVSVFCMRYHRERWLRQIRSCVENCFSPDIFLFEWFPVFGILARTMIQWYRFPLATKIPHL